MGRSRSRSYSRSRSRSPNRQTAKKKSPSRYEMDNDCKIYIGGLRRDSDEKELEKIFSRYGAVQDVWIARSPPGFGFVELDDPDDASDAIRDLDGTMMCGVKVRVSHSCSRKNLPSVKGMRKPFDVRCYECGEFGHFAYECRERAMRLRRPSYSRSRSRSPRRRERPRSPSPPRDRERERVRYQKSPSASPPPRPKKHKKKKSKSASPAISDDGKKKKNYRKKHDSDSETESPRKKEKKRKEKREKIRY